MHAMPVLIAILCLMAIAYRYYSAFLAAKVAALDDLRQTPAVKLNDGQNYHPTNKWVLFGHHFAAISGAGPLIGPVLAAQFGYLPGLLWIVIGVCLGGAVQDFLVLSASLRRGGRSLAQIAFSDIGKVAGTAAMIAILFIIIIALAGLGKVVVEALGGPTVKYPAGSRLLISSDKRVESLNFMPQAWEWEEKNPSLGFTKSFPWIAYSGEREKVYAYDIPAGWKLQIAPGHVMPFTEGFQLKTTNDKMKIEAGDILAMPADAIRTVKGSSWGTFTIACTIPIALFVGLYMYKIRPGKVVEASLIGAVLTIGATVAGGFIQGSSIEHFFNLRDHQVILAMAVYGFIASVLPVWVLLCPRDYLSSFLKIGTIALLVIGTLVANPKFQAPAINHVFTGGGPVLAGKIFPFLFITIMCGAISGFHALVSSGTTPKMIKKESDARTIGYGAMLIEGLVGVVAMIAASTLPPKDYYAMNVKMGEAPKWHDKIELVGGGGGVEHLNVYEDRTRESLRGRTGGAVTLAVGMAKIFDEAIYGNKTEDSGPRTERDSIRSSPTMRDRLWSYWYHFAIMFEALFILTTIDTGTRIGRFLLQEAAGKIHPKLGQTGWWPGAIISTLVIVVGWAYFINANNFAAIWAMFGIANQMLAAIALAIVSAYLVNEGRGKYLLITILPMCVVLTTTSTAAMAMLNGYWNTIGTQLHNPIPDRKLISNSILSGILTLAMLGSAYVVVIGAMKRCFGKRSFSGSPEGTRSLAAT